MLLQEVLNEVKRCGFDTLWLGVMVQNIRALAWYRKRGFEFLDSMPFTMTLACLQMGLSPVEALCAATINAAWSIGLGERKGSLEPGKDADLNIWDIPSLNFIPYHFGSSHIRQVLSRGRCIHTAE